MAGHFELSKNGSGSFSFVLRAGNGETILRSEQYSSKDAAQNGIASVRTNSAADDRYERKESANGKWFFNLRSGNQQVIGSSQMYESARARDAGIASVKANGASSTVDDKTKP